MKSYGALIKNRSFRFYLYSGVAGTFASGLNYIVSIWLILQFHSTVNASLTGMVLFWLPSVVLSPYFGAMIDHHDKKKMIIIAESLRVLVFIAFGVAMKVMPGVQLIYLLLIISGCFGAFYGPLAPAFVHELVSSKQLISATAAVRVSFQLGNIIGRGLITVAVLSFLSTVEALLVIALLYLISTLLMLPVQRHHIDSVSSDVSRNGFLKRMVMGYEYLGQHKALLGYVVVQALISLSLMAAPVLVGPYVKNILHESNRIFGLSEAMLSIGSVAGAFVWTYMATKVSTSRCVVLASLLAAVTYTALGFNASVIVALVGFSLLGFSWGSAILILTTVQHMTVPAFQGRVQAVVTAISTMVFLLFLVVLYGAKISYDAQDAFLLLAGNGVLIAGMAGLSYKKKTSLE